MTKSEVILLAAEDAYNASKQTIARRRYDLNDRERHIYDTGITVANSVRKRGGEKWAARLAIASAVELM